MLTALSIGIAMVAVALCVVHLLALIDETPTRDREQPERDEVPAWMSAWVPTAFSLDHPPRPTTAIGRAELELRRYLELGEIDDEEYHRKLDELTGRRRPTGGRPA